MKTHNTKMNVCERVRESEKNAQEIRLPRHCEWSGRKKKRYYKNCYYCSFSLQWKRLFPWCIWIFFPLFISFHVPWCFFSLPDFRFESLLFFSPLARAKLMIFFNEFYAHLREYDVIITERKNTYLLHFFSQESFWSLIIPRSNDVISYILVSLLCINQIKEKRSGINRNFFYYSVFFLFDVKCNVFFKLKT